MSDTQRRANDTVDDPYSVEYPEPTRWVGMVVFAGVMLIMLGAFESLQGFVAIVRDDYYLVTRDGLLLSMDYTAWGWTHLVIGLLAMLTGIGIFFGKMWARVLGIGLAGISALANIAFLPAYPIWCTIVIAFDVLSIYALAAHGREIRIET